MATQCVCSSEPSSASPLPACLKISLTDELLLAGMKTLMTFPVVLPSESLATYGTYKWSLIRVSTKVRTQIVCPRETLGAKRTLKGGRVFLHTFCITAILSRLIFGVC